VFKDKAVDVIFSVGTASAKSMRDFRQYPYAYEEIVPIEIYAVDKTGISGTKLRWKAEAELRRITEAYPLANIRWVTRVSDNEKKLGSQTLYSVKYELGYIRPTAATETFPMPPYIPFQFRSGAGIPNLDGPCENPLFELLYFMDIPETKEDDATIELTYVEDKTEEKADDATIELSYIVSVA
jgi:hypothetical protein